MKNMLIIAALSLLASCSQAKYKSDLQASREKLLVSMKKCLDADLAILKSDLDDCEKEQSQKGKISKGQLAKELRECRDQANAKYDTESKKCQ